MRWAYRSVYNRSLGNHNLNLLISGIKFFCRLISNNIRLVNFLFMLLKRNTSNEKFKIELRTSRGEVFCCKCCWCPSPNHPVDPWSRNHRWCISEWEFCDEHDGKDSSGVHRTSWTPRWNRDGRWPEWKVWRWFRNPDTTCPDREFSRLIGGSPATGRVRMKIFYQLGELLVHDKSRNLRDK